jgi:hypothetical protein
MARIVPNYSAFWKRNDSPLRAKYLGIRSAEYWRAYYTQKQREWRAAHYWRAYYTQKRQREQRAAHSRARKRRKQKIAAQTAHGQGSAFPLAIKSAMIRA